MAQQSGPRADPRPPWTRQRVLRAAIDLADQDGIESLSMRKLSQLLGGAPMSLYNHIANKDDLLDGMIDAVSARSSYPPARTAGRQPCVSGPSRSARSCRDIAGPSA
jgi:AcrR family transcriptional regulator